MTQSIKLHFLLALFFLSLMSACSQDSYTESQAEKLVSDLANASLPNLFRDNEGTVWLSYVSKDLDEQSDTTTLWLRQWLGQEWSAAELVAQGDDWFVNWADFPSVVKRGDNFVAHWLQKNGSDTYAYGVRYAIKNSSKQWQEKQWLHTDTSETEHGFVSLSPEEKGVHAIWLDGRNMSGASDHGHTGHQESVNTKPFSLDSIQGMGLRYAFIDNNGQINQRQELDVLTCDCCQTTSVLTAQGLLIAYRDRVIKDARNEIRDIQVLRQTDNAWQAVKNIPIDNWNIQACPVNGPVLIADAEKVALAWFTAADNVPKVQVAFSADAGASFGPAHVVESDNNLGRVAAVWLDSGRVVIAWLGNKDSNTQLLYRVVEQNGNMLPTQSVALMDSARASGLPQIEKLADDKLLFVWTKSGEISSIQSKVITLKK